MNRWYIQFLPPNSKLRREWREHTALDVFPWNPFDMYTEPTNVFENRYTSCACAGRVNNIFQFLRIGHRLGLVFMVT